MSERNSGEVLDFTKHLEARQRSEQVDGLPPTELEKVISRIDRFAQEGKSLCYPTGRFKRRVYVERFGETMEVLALDRRAPICDVLIIKGIDWGKPSATTQRWGADSAEGYKRISVSQLQRMADWLEATLPAPSGELVQLRRTI